MEKKLRLAFQWKNTHSLVHQVAPAPFHILALGRRDDKEFLEKGRPRKSEKGCATGERKMGTIAELIAVHEQDSSDVVRRSAPVGKSINGRISERRPHNCVI
jgi:hypothetical protein